MDGEGAFSTVSMVKRANETEQLEEKSRLQQREINTLKFRISQLAKMNKSQSIHKEIKQLKDDIDDLRVNIITIAQILSAQIEYPSDEGAGLDTSRFPLRSRSTVSRPGTPGTSKRQKSGPDAPRRSQSSLGFE